MFPFRNLSKKDLPLFDVHHRPFPSPHLQKKRRKWDEGANVWRQRQMQPLNILKNYSVKCLVWVLLLTLQGSKTERFLHSCIHTRPEKKNGLAIYFVCECECVYVGGGGGLWIIQEFLMIWNKTIQKHLKLNYTI